jgi:hypothetical protein
MCHACRTSSASPKPERPALSAWVQAKNDPTLGVLFERRDKPPAGTQDVTGTSRRRIEAVVIVSSIALVVWQWPAIALLYRWVRTPAVVEAPKEQPPATRPMIGDRLDRGGQQAPSQPPGAASPGTGPATSVAQRAVLYEEDPAGPPGNRFVGSAIWRIETVSPGPGRAPELAVRADIEIPTRKISMNWSLRRNTDQSLPASHTIEIMFKLPADFSSGSISNVPGILMKQAEPGRGEPLAGLGVKVTNNFFMIGLSAAAADRARNLQMLKERPWIDIPVVYTNNRRAIVALEKGAPGERAFADAFKAWGQSQAHSTWQTVTVENNRPDIKTPFVQSRLVGRGLQMFLVNATDTRIRNIRVWCQYSFGGASQSTTLFVPNTLSPGDEFQPDRSFFDTLQCRAVSFEREIKPTAGAL